MKRSSPRKALKTERISARLSPEAASRLRELARLTDKDISEVIINSIMDQYDRLMSTRSDPLSIFESAGFIGCAEGPKDLSTSYKKYLNESLRKKHDPR